MTLLDLYDLFFVADAYKTGSLPLMRKVGGVWVGEDWDGFTRAGATATRVNSVGLVELMAANVPRLDWFNPVTGGVASCPSVLVEGAATNLLLRSQEFNQAAVWAPSGTPPVVTANSHVAPDGTMTADSISFSGVGVFVSQSVGGYSAVTGQSFTISIFSKSATRQISFGGATIAGTDVVRPTIALSGVNVGWYRHSITRTFTTTTTGSIQMLVAASVPSGAGSGIFWGAMGNAGTSASSYIPTTTAAATRNADELPNITVSDIFSQNKGTIFMELLGQPFGTGNPFFALADSSNNPLFWFYADSSGDLFFTDGAETIQLFSTGKIAIIFNSDSVVFFLNGALLAIFQGITLVPDRLVFPSNEANYRMRKLVLSRQFFSQSLCEIITA